MSEQENISTNEFLTSQTTKAYRENLTKALKEIQDKKPFTLLNWLTMVLTLLTVCAILLAGILYIVRAENGSINKDNESIKNQLKDVIEDVKEIKNEIKEVRCELKEVSKKVQTREQLRELASKVAREACIEYHSIRDRYKDDR